MKGGVIAQWAPMCRPHHPGWWRGFLLTGHVITVGWWRGFLLTGHVITVGWSRFQCEVSWNNCCWYWTCFICIVFSHLNNWAIVVWWERYRSDTVDNVVICCCFTCLILHFIKTANHGTTAVLAEIENICIKVIFYFWTRCACFILQRFYIFTDATTTVHLVDHVLLFGL